VFPQLFFSRCSTQLIEDAHSLSPLKEKNRWRICKRVAVGVLKGSTPLPQSRLPNASRSLKSLREGNFLQDHVDHDRVSWFVHSMRVRPLTFSALSAFIAGGIAACGAVTATHPFETVKIRLQLQGELQSKDVAIKKYRGVFHGVKVIVQNEGVKGIYRGIGAAYIYQTLLNGCRLGFYEPLRVGLTQLLYKDSAVQSLGINIFTGAASGILGAAVGSPFFLVKTRLQSYSPFLPVGTQHGYKNSVDGLRKIYGAEGVRGLYRGVGAAMVRTGFGSSVQLPTYFFAKRRLIRHLGMEDGPALHLASSTASGFAVCCVMHPPGKSIHFSGN
jgi:solute carrier family 25 protein 34/35